MTAILDLEADGQLIVSDYKRMEFDSTANVSTYEAPILSGWDEADEKETWIWWIVLVGFLYVATLYWADRCRSSGGWPVTRFYWYKGYEVSCNR
jgi:hypothetical protein